VFGVPPPKAAVPNLAITFCHGGTATLGGSITITVFDIYDKSVFKFPE